MRSSDYPGISYITSRREWHSRATVNGHRIHLGYYKTELAAVERAHMFWTDWMMARLTEAKLEAHLAQTPHIENSFQCLP